MSQNGPAFADDDSLSQKVPVDRENTLKMIRGDYEEPWKGVLREAIQNAADAWGRNIVDGVLPEDSELEIEIRLDTQNQIFTYRDNAGGMSKEILEKNLVGIDTPDEIKEKGESIGAYGRGFHVISSVGAGKTYVESKYQEDHYSVTLDKKGNYSPAERPDSPQLEGQGTFMRVRDVVEHDVKNKLGDWGAVEEVLIENFNFLLLESNVKVTYSIDGHRHSPTPVDLHRYKENGQIRQKDHLKEFQHLGESYQIRDLVVVRTDVVDEDPPWEGVAMLKGNEYVEHPFMTVQTYKPHNIRSLNKPAKMFGWCNANDLCPTLENNAHTKFNQAALRKSGLKDELYAIHSEHFRREQKTNERKELRGDITEQINELLVTFDDFDEYQILTEGVEVPGGRRGNGPSEGEIMTGEGSGYTMICQAGQRDFDVGDNVPLQVAIENPDDSDIKKFEIFDIRVTSAELDGEPTFTDKTVDIGPNETKIIDLKGFTPSEEGRYIFRAKGKPAAQDEPVEHANLYIRVGDVEPAEESVPGEPGGGGGGSRSGDNGGEHEGDGPGHTTTRQVAIVERVNFSPDPDDDYKAALERGEHGGFEVLINTDRPEWTAAEEIKDDSRRKMVQVRLGTLWGIEQIILNRNIDDLHEVVSRETSPDEIKEEITDRLIAREKLMSEIESIVASEHGIGYE